MNKDFLRTKFILLAIVALLTGSFLWSSCAKMEGHAIAGTTVVVKSGLINFSVKDTLHTLLTTADTVNFTTATTPSALTTIHGSNLPGKNLSFDLTVAALTTGTYTIKTFQITYLDGSNNQITTSTTNTGTVTITSYNAAGGLLIGTFSTTVKNTNTTTVAVTGNFSIQQ